MTEEQCTHLRGTIAHCRKIGEIGAFTAGGVEDLLDTIDALRAELAALRSAPVAVEVPEPVKWLPPASGYIPACPGTLCMHRRPCDHGRPCSHPDEAAPIMGFVLNPSWIAWDELRSQRAAEGGA